VRGCYTLAMSLLPPDNDLEPIHTRQYETRVYRAGEDELLVRGAVSDVKPGGLYVLDDPEPLEVHQMQIELRVALPHLEITAARVLFESHPHEKCPLICEDYEQLVGVSIARGFSRKIQELFGRQRGCTHTNALLQAMAPAVVQATWSVSIQRSRDAGRSPGLHGTADREARIDANTNTCHIWDERGEHVAALKRGDPPQRPMLVIEERLRELGRDDTRWE